MFHGEADESVDWEAGDVVVRVRSRKAEREGIWSRKEGGIMGRVTLSVVEVNRNSSPRLTFAGFGWIRKVFDAS